MYSYIVEYISMYSIYIYFFPLSEVKSDQTSFVFSSIRMTKFIPTG